MSEKISEAISSAVIATVVGERAQIVAGLKSSWFGARAVGRAFTVRGTAGDNLALHQATVEAAPGDVLVCELEGSAEGGHWGDLLTISAQVRGIAGLIIGGTTRDKNEIAARKFPLFHTDACPRQLSKAKPGSLRVAIRLGGVGIHPGDLVVADDDGIIVVPQADVERVIADAAGVIKREEEFAARLSRGETTIELFNLKDKIA